MKTTADGSLQRALEPADQHHLQLGVDHVEDVEALAAVARLQEPARAAERVDELAALVDEQARRHDLVEQRVVGPEQLRQRVARRRRLRGRRGDARLGRRGGCSRASTGMRTSLCLR